MTLDMSQFHNIFFQESFEGLDSMEQSLLSLSETESPEQEEINTIFRAAHSMKGSSGTLGFTQITEFTHQLETLLDQIRSEPERLKAEIVNLLLKCCDGLRTMVTAHANQTEVNQEEIESLNQQLKERITQNQQPFTQASEKILPAANTLGWHIHFAPHPHLLMTGNEPLRLFRELAKLGELSVEAHCDKIPNFYHLNPDECHLSWDLKLITNASEDQITEIFEWVMDECNLKINPLASLKDETVEPPHQADKKPTATAQPTGTPPPTESKAQPKEISSLSTNSIRVDINKIDSLINLVGELVITQSMLSALGTSLTSDNLERVQSGLEQLRQNTRELQDSVLRIRMLPINYAFKRLPRLVHELSQQTDKKIELLLNGQQTELDKTVLEQINDPLVHLVRNAIDHGLETTEQRKAAGKPQVGQIKLNAFHKGGNIVIELSDDGQGINIETVREKAIERGLVSREQQLSEQQIYELIFEPGLTTSESVSKISGRGVGMDVIRRNILSLGGRIEISSHPGVGSTFTIYLPLTLAILDGQLIRVGTEIYVIPLITIIESIQIKQEQINRVSGNITLYRLRDENIPIIQLHQEFEISNTHTELESSLLVVVEGDGRKVGLLADELLAQQQVVIKSLEENYQRIEGVSGATILGDGSVSLILDIAGLIQRAMQRALKGEAA